ncbi:hypothetical protein [Exiguobacterium profundum]|uniref:hypothetical protein n=1 Tax=Exiguobacterium profundum TaxID=307643 RepID=UPI0028A9E42A|nr:hypothetical protein [Exiguobacterium profundum]
MWNRKIVTTSIASPVYAILLACGVTMMGVGENGGMSSVLNGFLLMTVAYVAVSFPIMLTYGVVTSWCSDWLANRLSSKRFRWFTSLVLLGGSSTTASGRHNKTTNSEKSAHPNRIFAYCNGKCVYHRCHPRSFRSIQLLLGKRTRIH